MSVQLEVVQGETVTKSRYIGTLEHIDRSEGLGYHIGGAFAGPKLLVTADMSLLASVFDRLSNLPTLPWMRGELWMINLNAFDDSAKLQVPSSLWDTPFDATIMLPYEHSGFPEKSAIAEGYWTVLRLCADLGMISGRGVHAVSNSNFAHSPALKNLQRA